MPHAQQQHTLCPSSRKSVKPSLATHAAAPPLSSFLHHAPTHRPHTDPCHLPHSPCSKWCLPPAWNRVDKGRALVGWIGWMEKKPCALRRLLCTHPNEEASTHTHTHTTHTHTPPHPQQRGSRSLLPFFVCVLVECERASERPSPSLPPQRHHHHSWPATLAAPTSLKARSNVPRT